MNTETSSDTEILVPEKVASFLLGLTQGDSFPEFELPGFPTLRFGEVEVSHDDSNLRVEGDRLILTLANPRSHQDLYPIDFSASLSGTDQKGHVVNAKFLVRARVSGTLRLEFREWYISEPTTPSLWLAELDGVLGRSFSGNLIVERRRDDGIRLGLTTHFRFAGEYTYFLVQSADGSCRLLIDAGQVGAPDREVLAREFLLLQFVLGRTFRMSPLRGLSEAGQVIASTSGCDSASHRQSVPIPPVPFERDNESHVVEAWAPMLFEHISQFWKLQPQSVNAYTMALAAYLDSATNYLDADYLRLQVTLEAFAYWDLRRTAGEEKLVVNDKNSWKSWVKANAETIRGFAGQGFAESLYNKVMGVYRLSSGRVVASAFLAHDLPLREQMLAEVEARDVVVHQGMMSPEGSIAERDILRIGTIRSLLIALLCKSVGYQGAIRGWSTGSFGRPVEPDDWWKVSDRARELARTTYSAS